jgi:2-oxoglutarate dehydrogenase E1 component
MQVVNCTTPAQYFHVLRRQMYGGADGRGLLKPLVIFTPKRMLRHPKAISHIEEFAQGEFHKVIGDESTIDRSTVTRIVFCCGQLYYDLVAAREQKKADNVAVVRVEQLYPFPASQLDATLSNYPAGTEIAWVQEEPRNMGAWRFVEENLPRPLRYIGRPASASPAAGSLKRHQEEQAEIIDEVFAAESRSTSRGDESNS